jgi:hypothetical protein
MSSLDDVFITELTQMVCPAARARVQHVFRCSQTSPGGRIVRTIGIVRAKAKIGLPNLVYNIRRLDDVGADGYRMTEQSA